eukprot:763636-Hanusia_phi.AAC.4
MPSSCIHVSSRPPFLGPDFHVTSSLPPDSALAVLASPPLPPASPTSPPPPRITLPPLSMLAGSASLRRVRIVMEGDEGAVGDYGEGRARQGGRQLVNG